jgi:CHASE3 domain sensor protein
MKEAIIGTGQKWSLSRLNWRAIIAGLVLIAAGVTVAVSVGYSRQQRELAGDLERHSFEVLLQTQRLASAVDKAEIGSRGYLFTGDLQFLNIFNEGVNRVPRELSKLKQLTRDNPAQQNNIEELSLVRNASIACARQSSCRFRAIRPVRYSSCDRAKDFRRWLALKLCSIE